MPNRLALEQSPYLRQHADNPVDWHPYGKAAFALSTSLDRPILLSIGYSACHWCHVMAHESFADLETAQLMNDRYVNIKVDREELPDVDQIYQRALALQGQSGGWPLTMVLTPDGTPYFGGTYFPPDDRYGRPGFRRVLTALSEAWRTDRDGVLHQASKYRDGLASLAARELEAGDAAALRSEVLYATINKLAERVDPINGGFGEAPKFPNASAVRLLMRGGKAFHAGVHLTLTKMSEGGIYDHVGGGFARYSTDAKWRVPHFEKMLYDNAQLLRLYADGVRLLGYSAAFARVISETASWMDREMCAPEGGFYTALDADSEGLEGRFYVWTWIELAAVLTPPELEVARALMDAREEGNWIDPHGHSPPGANVLQGPPGATPQQRAQLAPILRKLLLARAPRPRPGTDDKILAGLNGLAIAGLAEAGATLDDPALIDAARRTAEFVLAHMRDEGSGRLFRTWKNGEKKLPGTLDDHAYVADGLFALYEATGEARWFDAGHALLHLAVALFWDDERGVFYLTSADEPELPALIERPISGHDGALPAGASVLCERLLVIGEATGERRLVEVAEQLLRRRATAAMEQPFAYAHLLGAVDTLLRSPTLVVVTGSGPTHDALVRTVMTTFSPMRLLVRKEGTPLALHALVADKDLAPAAFVCHGQRCDAPTCDAQSLRAALTTES